MKLRIIYFLLFVICSSSIAEVKIDGKLDEEIWKSAQKFTDFMVVNPYTLSLPEYQTEVFVASDSKGIYFGIINYQPKDSINSDSSARDQSILSDKNQIVIDFATNGITAYSFEIGAGNSMRDGIYSDEKNYSSEWDGNWIAKSIVDETSWVSEVLIPWDIVSMKNNDEQERTLKWYVSRTSVNTNQKFANIAIDDNRQRFLTGFSELKVKDYVSSSLQVFGYGVARYDFVGSKDFYDAGADVFWKSGNGKQLTATLNPNFGQVESDSLVVNFSATETFFDEKRPFFTENQSLFDVKGANGLRMIHTRRIGATPDVGSDTSSAIDAAVKFSDSRDNMTYGVLAAKEAGGSDYKGRDFFAGRYLFKSEKQSIGLTGTYVDREDINREAKAFAFEHEYLHGDNLRVESQVLGTDIQQSVNGENLDKTGVAFWSKIEHEINDNYQQSLQVSSYDEDFEINDFGYLGRNNVRSLNYESVYKNTNFGDDTVIQQKEYYWYLNHTENAKGLSLSNDVSVESTIKFKDSSSFSWNAFIATSGVDDRISRNNGLVNYHEGYGVGFTYRSNNINKFRYHGFINLTDSFHNGNEVHTHFHPSYFFKDNYSVSLSIFYNYSDSWLNWLGDNEFGRYDRKFLDTSLDFNANFSQRQELRFRLQWLAMDAHAGGFYQLDSSGDLITTNSELSDFHLSNTALQLRYRYEIAPLSNLYIVYSRGAGIFEDTHMNISNLFTPGFNEVDSDMFLIKVRYKFF